MPSDGQLDSSLKWKPLCRTKGADLPLDGLEPSQGSVEFLALAISSISSQSTRYVSIPQTLAILDLSDDTEVEETPDLGHNKSYEPRSPGPSRPPKIQSPRGFRSRSRPALFDARQALFPLNADPSATSTLLSGFMELRAVKKPRLSLTGDSRTRKNMVQRAAPPSTSPHDQQSLSEESTRALTPAPTPQYRLLINKGPCIVSLSLGRPVLQLLERSWPSHLIFDRDYRQHDARFCSSEDGAPNESVSPLCFEADISLSPSTGVIATTLVKAKQKPLPGSDEQPLLRERVQRVSQRYQTLIVLVSEYNPAGEVSGNQSPADMAAYAHFACFAASLDGQVVTYFVPGAEMTLSQ